MKAFIIGTTFILAIASFGSAAYANENDLNKGACFIPPPSTTGGGTLRRLQAIQRCGDILPPLTAKQYSGSFPKSL